ncbi:MAG: [FeFe] hydrogenase H-cluster radical SAM maturase HydE [Bacteroidales bacterium]|nr:[FeFe] hydrogenase H-cluster radical SAM maturase HydE [Bacteroidales bacterium]
MDCTKGRRNLQQEAYALKLQHRGLQVYFRGLIEISNRCGKNCLYCGIRAGNAQVCRYEMSDEQVLREAQFALDAGYGSVAIQGGERSDSEFIEKITRLVWQIRHLQKGGNPESVMQLASEKASTLPLNNLGITLSLGEQPQEVYREWKKAGVTRYLLRIETSNKELYEKIHPGFALTGNNAKDAANHSMLRRLQALADLKSENYLLGSGVMIGLPFQTYEHLQEDLQFLKNLGVDMVGMGPYIPHYDTPLGQIVSHWRTGTPLPDNLKELASQPRGDFWNMSNSELLEVSLQMVARLRILLPDINIAATTALQVLDPMGREQALLHGANVIMPNMTETQLRGNYSLYQGKQGVEDDAVSTRDKLLENLSGLGISVGWDERGDRR